MAVHKYLTCGSQFRIAMLNLYFICTSSEFIQLVYNKFDLEILWYSSQYERSAELLSRLCGSGIKV